MALVERMSGARRHPPADTLLLRERLRRMRSAFASSIEHADELLVESDAIIEEAADTDALIAAPAASASAGAISLYRPLAQVTLERAWWSGAVDHATLQSAIVCAPARTAAYPRAPSWLGAVTTLALPDVPHDETALHVALGEDDVAVLSRVGTRLTTSDAVNLVRAAALPSTIVGADAQHIAPAASVLTAYRHAALVHAWQSALSGSATSDTVRDRDAAAVQVLSMLRALLGDA